MRFALFAVMVFLWGIWFAVASINHGGEFGGTQEQNFIGLVGLTLVGVAAVFLVMDWIKKENVSNRIRKRTLDRKFKERRH